jgi:3-methyladenine DNA glycosylase AlkD
MKGEARFRGTRMADVRRIVREWWPADGDVELACRLIEEPITEDKLAGIIALGEILQTGDVARFERLFAEGHIRDWGVCDWLCVKVLGPMVQREEDPLPLAETIAAWRESEPIWQRRASVVAFVKLVPKPEEHFRGFVELVLGTCETITRTGKERFVQTGAGWVLRELRRASPDEVDAWLARNGDLLTADARQSLKPRARGRSRGRARTATA